MENKWKEMLLEIYNLGQPPGVESGRFEPMNVDVTVLKYFSLGVNKQQVLIDLKKNAFEGILDEEGIRARDQQFVEQGWKSNYQEENRVVASYFWGKVGITPDTRTLAITFYFSDDDKLIDIKTRYMKTK